MHVSIWNYISKCRHAIHTTIKSRTTYVGGRARMRSGAEEAGGGCAWGGRSRRKWERAVNRRRRAHFLSVCRPNSREINGDLLGHDDFVWSRGLFSISSWWSLLNWSGPLFSWTWMFTRWLETAKKNSDSRLHFFRQKGFHLVLHLHLNENFKTGSMMRSNWLSGHPWEQK